MSTARGATRALLLAVTLCWTLVAAAQVPVPPVTGHVTDQTNTLTTEQKASLEQTLTAFEARKGSQLAVLVLASTAPEAIEQYALRVAEQWKLGRKKVDDGAILVVAKDDRTMRIEVGYGLEGALNDLTSKRIISEIILPRFKSQDFYGGITAGVGQIIRVIDGEPLPEPSKQPAGSLGDIQQYAPIVFILALVVGGVLRAALGRVPGALVTGGGVAVLAWFVAGAVSVALLAGVMALFVTLLGGGMGRHGLGGHYGGGGRGGSGGGGFRGGGGGFGGGGASGRW
ncbi:TPM domain-containing protein [Rhodoferax ferrireducens]|uniref:TPM domain-containing protein n=1 Tax=Rhodoferax ferrireducens TaxID=192843 RepID=UPI000E0D1B5B|nr:YgcG family protein [Rhodoferax ferrireducens]